MCPFTFSISDNFPVISQVTNGQCLIWISLSTDVLGHSTESVCVTVVALLSQVSRDVAFPLQWHPAWWCSQFLRFLFVFSAPPVFLNEPSAFWSDAGHVTPWMNSRRVNEQGKWLYWTKNGWLFCFHSPFLGPTLCVAKKKKKFK